MRIPTNQLPWWGEVGLAMLAAGVLAGANIVNEYLADQRRIVNADSNEADEEEYE